MIGVLVYEEVNNSEIKVDHNFFCVSLYIDKVNKHLVDILDFILRFLIRIVDDRCLKDILLYNLIYIEDDFYVNDSVNIDSILINLLMFIYLYYYYNNI